MPQRTRDPIKKPPLREPGQSVRESLNHDVDDHVVAWFVVAVMAIVVAGLEWWRWVFSIPISPILFSVGAVAIVLIAAWRGWVGLRGIHPLRLGLKGERSVGQFLQIEMSRREYAVMHDICCDGFNIDHVLIGPGGVFAVETKTRMKPDKPDSQVTYDGVKVRVHGWEPVRDPIVQARAAATRLSEILVEYAGATTRVRPVVLFPGWFVAKQPKGVEVWVLNEKSLVGFIDNEPPTLTAQQQRMMVEGLARYVRDHH